MSRRCAPVLLSTLVLGALLLAPAARADTVSSSGGQVTFTQTSEMPQRLLMYAPADDLVMGFGVAADQMSLTCGVFSTQCPLNSAPSQINVVLGDGDNVVRGPNVTRQVPLHFDTGGGKDLVELPRNASANTVIAGAGDDVVNARNDAPDTIDCGAGYDTVLIDPAEDAADVTTDCERVVSEPGSVDAPRAAELDLTFFRSWPVTAHFTVTQNATAAQMLCWIDDSGFAPCPNPYTPPNLPDGRHDVLVAAELTVDGQRTDTLATDYYAHIDRVAPPAPILDAPTGVVRTHSPTWKLLNGPALGAAEAYFIGCTIDGGQPMACDTGLLPAPLNLPDGPHTLTAQASDIAGNQSPVSTYRFIIDTAAPSPPSVRSVRIRGRTATVSVTLEPGSSLQCSVNGSRFVDCPNPYVHTARRSGTIFLSFRAVDAAGNTGPSTAVAATLRLARLTANIRSKVVGGRLTAVCHVRDAALKSCSARVRAFGSTLASGSSQTSSLKVLLTRSAARQLARRGTVAAKIAVTAVTMDGQRVTVTRSIHLRA